MAVIITGNNTPTAGGVTYGNGSTYANTAAGTSGQFLQSNGSSAPTWVAAPSPAGGATATSPMSANVTLTSSSNKVQVLTPDAFNRQIILPDATTIGAAGGPIFVLQNTVTWYPVAVMDSAGNNVGWVVADYESSVYLTSTASATGNWVIKTGNPSADAGIYPYGPTYLSSSGSVPQLSTYAVANQDGTVVVFSPNGGGGYQWSFDTRANKSNGYSGSANLTYGTYAPDTANAMALVALSSGVTVTFYSDQGTNTDMRCFACSYDAAGSITKGTELVLVSGIYAGGLFCASAIDSTRVLVTYANPGTGYTRAQIITVSGTTCTAGTAVTVASVASTNYTRCAVLSSTLAHVVTNQRVYDLTLSTSTITVNSNVSLGATHYGVVANSSTSSIAFYSDGSGGVIAKVATSSGGTPTLGTASGVLGSNNYPSVSQIKAGLALIINGNLANGITQPPFSRVGVSGGIPVLLSQGPAPANGLSNSYYVQTFNGLSMLLNQTGTYSSNGNTFRKIAITGGI